jgi:hypothetical protein
VSKLVPAGDEVVAYQGKMIEVVNQEMSTGSKNITFEWARRAPGIRLILVDQEKRTVLLTKEHRYELGVDDYRLPGGKVFDTLEEYNAFLKLGQDIIEPAIKKTQEEAEEEAGVELGDVKHFHTSICGTTVQWDLLYFTSTNWKKTRQKLETGEKISVVEVSFEEAKEMALDGRMSEERSALVILRYLENYKQR